MAGSKKSSEKQTEKTPTQSKAKSESVPKSPKSSKSKAPKPKSPKSPKSPPAAKDKKETKGSVDAPDNMEFFCIKCKKKVKDFQNLNLSNDGKRYIATCSACNCNLSRFKPAKKSDSTSE